MKYCPSCKIKVDSERMTCPICYHVLDDDKEKILTQQYPKHEYKHRMNFITKLFLLVSIIASIASVIVNLYTVSIGDSYYWSIIVVASIIYAWIIAKYVLYGHGIITGRIITAGILTSVIIYLIELFIVKSVDYWFSIDLVIPAIIVLSIIAVVTIMLIKKETVYDTLFPLFGLSIISNVPLLLIFIFDLNSFYWPPIACCATGIITLIYMLIFHLRDVAEEFKKRLHF